MIYCPVCGVTSSEGVAFTLSEKIPYIKHLRTHGVASLVECKDAADFVFAAAQRFSKVTVTEAEANLIRNLAQSYPELQRLSDTITFTLR